MPAPKCGMTNCSLRIPQRHARAGPAGSKTACRTERPVPVSCRIPTVSTPQCTNTARPARVAAASRIRFDATDRASSSGASPETGTALAARSATALPRRPRLRHGFTMKNPRESVRELLHRAQPTDESSRARWRSTRRAPRRARRVPPPTSAAQFRRIFRRQHSSLQLGGTAAGPPQIQYEKNCSGKK